MSYSMSRRTKKRKVERDHAPRRSAYVVGTSREHRRFPIGFLSMDWRDGIHSDPMCVALVFCLFRSSASTEGARVARSARRCNGSACLSGFAVPARCGTAGALWVEQAVGSHSPAVVAGVRTKGISHPLGA